MQLPQPTMQATKLACVCFILTATLQSGWQLGPLNCHPPSDTEAQWMVAWPATWRSPGAVCATGVLLTGMAATTMMGQDHSSVRPHQWARGLWRSSCHMPCELSLKSDF